MTSEELEVMRERVGKADAVRSRIRNIEQALKDVQPKGNVGNVKSVTFFTTGPAVCWDSDEKPPSGARGICWAKNEDNKMLSEVLNTALRDVLTGWLERARKELAEA